MRTKPTKKQIQKWCNALRSGKYAQTKEKLQDKNGYCCLGVACELFIPKSKRKYEIDNILWGGVPQDQPSAPLWLTNIDGRFQEKTRKFLTFINDNGYSWDSDPLNFDEIADVLEAVYIHEVLD